MEYQSFQDRISELEKKIYGPEKLLTLDDPLPETSAIDNLLHANTLISSALSGREKANAVINRLEELSEYLSPTYEESLLPTEAKIQLCLAMEPQAKENYAFYAKIQDLSPVLETNNFKDVLESTHKLSKLTPVYLESYQEVDQLNTNVKEIFSKYNSIIDNISKTLILFDTAITAIEIAATPVKHVD